MVRRFNVISDVFGEKEYSMSLNDNGAWVRWGDVAPLIAEASKPSHNSDYTAAIRCIKEYCQSRPDSTMIGVFRAWCEDRLNPAKRDFV